jgi:hypothetical protein
VRLSDWEWKAEPGVFIGAGCFASAFGAETTACLVVGAIAFAVLGWRLKR